MKTMLYVKKASSPLDALLSWFHATKFSKENLKEFFDFSVQPLHLASNYPFSYEVFHIVHSWTCH